MKYYDSTNMWDSECPINFALSGRGAGKSTRIAKDIAKYCVENDRQFILLTRNSMSKMTRYFEGYLRDSLEEEYGWHVEFGDRDNIIKVSDNDRTKKDIIGYHHYLSLQSTYKSNQFDKVDFIIYEEALTLEASVYYPDEFEMWLSYLSTVFRHRDDCKAVLIGNVMTASNPYFEGYGIPPECLRDYGCHLYNSCGVKVCVDVAPPAYESEDEIPMFMRSKGNEMNISGIYVDSSPFVIQPKAKTIKELKKRNIAIITNDNKFYIGQIRKGNITYPYIYRENVEGLKPTPKQVMLNKRLIQKMNNIEIWYFNDDYCQSLWKDVKMKYM